MENFTLEKDIKVFCLEAKPFPEGIPAAYQKLQSLLQSAHGRRYFGISRPENGQIVYKAAAEEMEEGEAEKLNCEPFVIKGGQYISIVIIDYLKDVQEIGRVFQQLTAYPGIDPEGYCIEMYAYNDKDVRCMVRLKS